MKPQVALVTGGIKGTGKEILKQFVDRGVHVITNYRKDEATAENFRKEFSGKTAKVHVMQADLGEEAEVHNIFEKAEGKEFGLILQADPKYQNSRYKWNVREILSGNK